MEIPAQAVRCRLYHVSPPANGPRLTKARSHHIWPQQASKFLIGYDGKTGVIFIETFSGSDVGRVGRKPHQELVVQVVL